MIYLGRFAGLGSSKVWLVGRQPDSEVCLVVIQTADAPALHSSKIYTHSRIIFTACKYRDLYTKTRKVHDMHVVTREF
jgi:hypothetical protein